MPCEVIGRNLDRYQTVLVIDKGAIVQNGPTDELVGNERTLEEALVAWGAAG